MTNEKTNILYYYRTLSCALHHTLHCICCRMQQGGKQQNPVPEVRNNGTAIQWRDTAEEEWHDLVALNTLRGTDGKNGKDGTGTGKGTVLDKVKEQGC